MCKIKILARPMYDFIAFCETCRTINDFIEIKKSRVLGDIVYAKHKCGLEYKISGGDTNH